MAVRSKSETNYYDLLEVPPHASADEIVAAYERLQALYSPERLQGGPPEFEELARQKRAELDAAYQVLGDPVQRAAYDLERGGAARDDQPVVLDFRPLPPARGQERSTAVVEASAEQPQRRAQPARMPSRLVGALIALGSVVLLLLLILSDVRVQGGQAALATPTVANVRLPFTQNQIEQFRAAAQTSNTAQTWAALGNALFDNLQTLRENAPQSPQYQGMIEQWREVAQAYERSLALEENETIRSDYALALLSYGIDARDAPSRERALEEARRALEREITEPRALINYGLVLVEDDPPRVEEATQLWQQAIERAPDSPEATRARGLLQSYGQGDDPQS